MQHQAITKQIIGCAMKVHRQLGPGFLESVYHNALAFELQRAGLPIDQERKIVVRYEGVVVGDFIADIVAADAVIVEIKAIQQLTPLHEVQLVNYLTATGIDIGLLLNFGADSLEFKRKTRLYQPVAT